MERKPKKKSQSLDSNTASARPLGRSLQDFPNLTKIERALVDSCRRGQPLIISNDLPTSPTIENSIRAELIRFLLLGGDSDNQVHEMGIWIYGAWIATETSNHLDLTFCNCDVPLSLVKCVVNSIVLLGTTTIRSATWIGCQLSGVRADGFHCFSSLMIKYCNCRGEVKLHGATIDGSLEFTGSRFENADDVSIDLDSLKVRMDVRLDTGFHSIGQVRMVGAVIGGDLSLRNGSFLSEKQPALGCNRTKVSGDVYLSEGFSAQGEVTLSGADVGGSVYCEDATFLTFKSSNAETISLSLERARIAGALFLRNASAINGYIDLSELKVGALVDDGKLLENSYILDGLSYDRFVESSPIEPDLRIGWLRKQFSGHIGSDFRPQPWEQVVKVLREMGHDGEARQVAIAKQEQMRIANKVGGFPQRQLHWLYGKLAGFGYRPLRTVATMGAVWIGCSIAFMQAEKYGLMGPSSPIITANTEISNVCGFSQGIRETSWTICGALPQEYTTFNSWLYSLDLILPLVELQQDADWAPIVMKDDATSNIWAGHFFRVLMWLEILIGWATSLLLVAVLGNLVKKD